MASRWLTRRLFPCGRTSGEYLPDGWHRRFATLPQARRRGYASALVTELLGMMRDNGYPVSTLYPFRPSFYGRLGFVGLPQTKTAVFPLSSVARLREASLGGSVRWGTLKEHYDAYRALIERLLADRHGFAVLPESRMSEFSETEDHWLATAWVDDTVAGAVTYRISGFGDDLVAGDLLAASPLGRALLLDSSAPMPTRWRKCQSSFPRRVAGAVGNGLRGGDQRHDRVPYIPRADGARAFCGGLGRDACRPRSRDR